jgi:hypothetical protein
MHANDKSEFFKLITMLGEAFGRQVSALTIEAYWIGLQSLPLYDVEKAVAACLEGSTSFPAPATLREMAGHVTPKARAEIAWELVVEAIRKRGGYASPDFEDRAINATLRGLGGWERITGTPSDELHSFVRQAFLKAYPAWLGRSDGPVGEHLPGIFECQEKGRFEIESIPCHYLENTERRFLLAPEPAKQIEGGR